jgi:hypothetical protein
MAKKDITKILTTGTLKNKLLILEEDKARHIFGKERLITDKEYSSLVNSLKTSREIGLFDKNIDSRKTVIHAIQALQGLKFEVMMHYSNLRGYILVWNSIEYSELLVNSILHEIKDPIERKRVANSGAKGIDILFSKTETDQEGYIDIKTDFEKDSYKGKKHGEKPEPTKEYSLWYVMNNVKKEAETVVIKYLSWEAGLLDFMEDKGYNVKTYKDHIKLMTEDVLTPIIGWAKYYGEINTGLPHPRMEEIIKKYAICPDIRNINIDTKERDFFRYEIMGDNEQK